MAKRQLPTKAGMAVAAGLLSALLAMPVPTVAFAATSAELQQEVESAQERWARLSSEAEQCEYDLISVRESLRQTQARIDELNEQIPQTEQQLQTAQDELGAIVAQNYKNGNPTLLDVVLGCNSFDEMVSRIVYFNKVAEHENTALATVQDYSNQLNNERSELEVEKANQERYVAEQEERTAQARAASDAAQSYYNSLSDELKKQIAEEQAAAQRAAIEQARQQQAAVQQRAAAAAAEGEEPHLPVAAQQPAAPAQEQQPAAPQAPEQQAPAPEQTPAPAESAAPEAPAPEPAPVVEETPAPAEPAPVHDEPAYEEPAREEPAQEEQYEEESNEYEEEDYDYSPSYAGSASQLVANAYSIIGSGYSWSGYNWTGSTSSSVFTCSGVVDFALGLPSQSNSPETLYAQVSNLVYDTSQLSYGDLVFYTYAGRYPGHVGIYIGGGSIIDSIPNGGVAIRDVNYMDFIGGGSIF